MSIHTSSQETINTLEAIFEKHKEERVCVIGTTCCGKSTLLKKIPDCVDMDEALWPLLTKEESDFVCQKPWTKEIGDYFDKLIYEKVKITRECQCLVRLYWIVMQSFILTLRMIY